MIKVLLWDLDGTITNFKTAQYNAIKSCFKKFDLGECTDEMVLVYSDINAKYWEALERGEMTKPQILLGRFHEFFSLYGVDETCIPDFEAEYQVRLGDTIDFYPGAYDIVTGFKGKIKQYLVTNGTKISQDRKLDNSGLRDTFDGLFISEDVGYEKPSIEYFNKVFEAIGPYKKEEIMIIGDSLTSDMKGGNNAGIVTCWFNPDGNPLNKPLRIDHEIKDLSELKEIVFK